MLRLGVRLGASFVAAITVATMMSGSASAATANWRAAWQGSPVLGSTSADSDCPTLANQTARNIITPSVDGSQVRVRISNAYGTTPLTVGAASIAPVSSNAGVEVRGLARVTVGRAASFTIPAGREALSDPIKLTVRAGNRLALSIFVPNAVPSMTQHSWSRTTNYVATGNQATNTSGIGYQPVSCWMLASGLDVVAPKAVAGTVVALGDSLTDGDGSTTDANHRYPDYLAQRLAAVSTKTLAVSNAGIAGNRLVGQQLGLPYDIYSVFGESALTRLSRDVISQPGVTDVVVLLGTVDVTDGTDTATFTSKYAELIGRLHAAGLAVHVGTLPPWGGRTTRCSMVSSVATCEAQRQEINTWIRTQTLADSVVDFDAAVRDPADPTRLLSTYASYDRLHLNDAGYARMAAEVSLTALLA